MDLVLIYLSYLNISYLKIENINKILLKIARYLVGFKHNITIIVRMSRVKPVNLWYETTKLKLSSNTHAIILLVINKLKIKVF